MTDSGEFDTRPVRAFLPGPDGRDQGSDGSAWPGSVPAMAQLLREHLEGHEATTVLNRDNFETMYVFAVRHSVRNTHLKDKARGVYNVLKFNQ